MRRPELNTQVESRMLSDVERYKAVNDINSRFTRLGDGLVVQGILDSPSSRMLTIRDERDFPDNSVTVRAGYGNTDHFLIAAPDSASRAALRWTGEVFVIIDHTEEPVRD